MKEDKLILEVPKPRPIGSIGGTTIMRTSCEAAEMVEEVSVKTGKSKSYILAEMVRYAYEHIEYI